MDWKDEVVAADISGQIESPRHASQGALRMVPLGFSVAGMTLVLAASQATLVTAIPISAEFGLFQLLPPLYWAGACLMGLAILLSTLTRSQGLVAVTGTLLMAVVGGTPILFEPNPPVWDAYLHLHRAQGVLRTGDLPAATVEYAANWPGFFIFAASMSSVTSLVGFPLLKIFPFLTAGLSFLALFLFLRSHIPASIAAGGSILGSLTNVWAQYHFSPQSFGFILALLVLAMAWRGQVLHRLVSAVLFVGLVVSHPTSTLVILGIIIVDLLFRSLSRVRSRQKPALSQSLSFSPALPFATVWVAWLFFRATETSRVAERTLIERMGFIVQVPEETLNLATARSVENLFLWAPLIRLVSLLAFGILAMVVVVVLLRRPQTRFTGRFLMAALAGVGLFGVLDILSFQGVFFDRSFMFFAVLAPAVGLWGLSRLFQKRAARATAAATLLALSLATAATLYYQESFYFVPDRSVAVSVFLQNSPTETLVLDGFYPVPIWLEEGREGRTSLGFYLLFPTPFEDLSGSGPVLAVYDSTSEIWYRQWRGINIYEYYLLQAGTESTIYDNGDTRIIRVASSPGG